jgi:hypothetical protein
VKVKLDARARRFDATRFALTRGGQRRVTHLPCQSSSPTDDALIGSATEKVQLQLPVLPSSLTSSPCLISSPTGPPHPSALPWCSSFLQLGQSFRSWSVHIFCRAPSLRATSPSSISKFAGRSSRAGKLTVVVSDPYNLLPPCSIAQFDNMVDAKIQYVSLPEHSPP